MELIDAIEAMQNVRNVVEINQVRRRRRVRLVRNRVDPFEEYDDYDFSKRYRFTKETVRYIVELLEDELSPMSINRTNISVELQVLVAIRFYAKSCYQLESGDLHGLSQPSVSRIVSKVSRALITKREEFIKWPVNIRNTQMAFHAIANFPEVVGVIDGTQIPIKNPDGANPMLYFCRKGFYSLNVQVICDAKSFITNIVARWRGSTHDSRIWNHCLVRQKFEANEYRGIILGDSGYPNSHYLLTPVLNPADAAQRAYNNAHKSTRVTIECIFGRWKSMFKALHKGFSVSLETTKKCIPAMAILYNIRLAREGPEAFEVDSDISSDDEQEQIPIPQDQRRGLLFRRQFINRHFAQREN